MVTIIPAILVETESEFKKKLEKVWGLVDKVQLDVVDGIYAPTKTVGPEVLKTVNTIVNFSVQLMVDKPEKWVERCKQAGATQLIGHVERMEDRTAFIADTQAAEMQVGLGFNIDTPVDGLEEVIHDLDAVLLMSVEAGKGGQKFRREVLEKIKQVRAMSKEVEIIVDGGLREEEIKRCIAADWEEEIEEDELNRSVRKLEFAVGMHLLSSDNVAEELTRLKKLEVHGE